MDEVDEHRQPQRVRQQDEFLTPIGGDMPDIGQKANSRKPLRLGDRLFDGELVQMANQRGDEFAQPWIGAVVEAGQHLPHEITC